MRHRKREFKIGRSPAHTRSLLSNQVCSLILEERIKTSVTRAKESRRLAEKLITLAKKGTLHHRRRAIAALRPNTEVKSRIHGGYKPVPAKQLAVRKLFEVLGPRYRERPGGYTRIIRLGQRVGDAAETCYLELVEAEMVPRTRSVPPTSSESTASELEQQHAAAAAAEQAAPPAAAEDADAEPPAADDSIAAEPGDVDVVDAAPEGQEDDEGAEDTKQE